MTEPTSSPTTAQTASPSTATSQSPAEPNVNVNSTSAKRSSTVAAAPVRKHDETAPLAAGGILALLVIGGAAVAMNRRRHEDEEQLIEEDSIDREPMGTPAFQTRKPMIDEEQPSIVAPPASAFAWGDSQPSSLRQEQEPMVERDDRDAGETWVERAYRGPSPLNPSASLKTRLRRAAFFDKRERQAAAGLAEPIDPTAGLPDRVVEERQAELA
jgi:hypothetical protein